jgi:hypothetical protein
MIKRLLTALIIAIIVGPLGPVVTGKFNVAHACPFDAVDANGKDPKKEIRSYTYVFLGQITHMESNYPYVANNPAAEPATQNYDKNRISYWARPTDIISGKIDRDGDGEKDEINYNKYDISVLKSYKKEMLSTVSLLLPGPPIDEEYKEAASSRNLVHLFMMTDNTIKCGPIGESSFISLENATQYYDPIFKLIRVGKD